MGNGQSAMTAVPSGGAPLSPGSDKVVVPHSRELPSQFITQAHIDWKQQLETLYKTRPTVTRTVILPPGTALNDERLALGKVTKETRTILTGSEAVLQGWPSDHPFEADVDGALLPPCRGLEKVNAHYAVYPDNCFTELQCGYWNLHKSAHPELHAEQRMELKKEASKIVEKRPERVGVLTDEERAMAKELVKQSSLKKSVDRRLSDRTTAADSEA